MDGMMHGASKRAAATGGFINMGVTWKGKQQPAFKYGE
jgi:hypothetical protein